MAATFPGGVKVFTTKQAGDQIASAHINDLQDEVVAVETELKKTTGSVVSHGSLAGLGDNDHPQYLLSASTNYPRADGWIPVSDTWTYTSATTITVPSGAASIYSVGDKIKLNNTDLKYFYIVGVADTVLTITGGSNYALDSDAISAVYYSKAVTPLGFPQWFNWTPNLDPNGTGTVLSGYTGARYNVSGRTVNFTFSAEDKAMTTRGGFCLIGLPVAPSASAVSARMYASIYPIGGNYIPVRCEIMASYVYMLLHKDFTYSEWVGNETGLCIYVSGFYEI